MVSDKILRNTEPSNELVEYEMCGYLTVGFNCGNSLSPFREIVNNHYNMMIPPTEAGLQSMKSIPHLVKGLVVIIRCNRVGCERILHVTTWKGWHFLTALTQSLKMDSQKYLALNIFWDVKIPDK